jgi:hypothetical protein
VFTTTLLLPIYNWGDLMLKALKIFYTKSIVVINWFSKRNSKIVGMNNGFIIFSILFVLLVLINTIFGEGTMYNALLSVLVIYIVLVFIIILFKFKIIPMPKIFFGEYNTSEKLFKSFTHRAFIYGLTIFITFISSFLLSIPTYISESLLKKTIDLNGFLPYFYSFGVILFTILWFSYHIVFETVNIKLIKQRISLYLAILITISLAFIWPTFQTNFKPYILSLTVGFALLKYIIDLKECLVA